MIQYERWDRIACIDPFSDYTDRILIRLIPSEDIHVYILNAVHLQIPIISSNIQFRRIYAGQPWLQVGFHQIRKSHIVFFCDCRHLAEGKRIYSFDVFMHRKINAHVACCFHSAAAFSHHERVEPILVAAI